MPKYFKLVYNGDGHPDVVDVVSCATEQTAWDYFYQNNDLNDPDFEIVEISSDEFNDFVMQGTEYYDDFEANPYTEWTLIETKSVQDSDGFWTDYCLWYNIYEDKYVCIFGDSDLYHPENSSPDAEFEDEDEAFEWFDSYTGFEDEDIEESTNIEGRQGFPQIVVVTEKAGPGAWNKFLDEIEERTGLEVDSAYRRRYDQWIELIDPETNQYFNAEITKYTDGTYEFRSDNMSSGRVR